MSSYLLMSFKAIRCVVFVLEVLIYASYLKYSYWHSGIWLDISLFSANILIIPFKEFLLTISSQSIFVSCMLSVNNSTCFFLNFCWSPIEIPAYFSIRKNLPVVPVLTSSHAIIDFLFLHVITLNYFLHIIPWRAARRPAHFFLEIDSFSLGISHHILS